MPVSPCYSCHRRDGHCERALWIHAQTKGNETMNYLLFSARHTELCTCRYFIHLILIIALQGVHCIPLYFQLTAASTVFSVNSTLKNADHLVVLSKDRLLGSGQEITYFTFLTFYNEIEHTYKNTRNISVQLI